MAEKGDMKMASEVGAMHCKDGGRGPELRSAGGLSRLKGQGKLL